MLTVPSAANLANPPDIIGQYIHVHVHSHVCSHQVATLMVREIHVHVYGHKVFIEIVQFATGYFFSFKATESNSFRTSRYSVHAYASMECKNLYMEIHSV